MGAITKVAKTATGVFAASVAKESYQAAKQIEEPVSRLTVTAAGSVSAAIAFHCLKNDVEEVADIVFNRK